jgi:hypothetical protein
LETPTIRIHPGGRFVIQYDVPLVLAAGTLAGAALALEHVTLYERISRVEAYTLGTATIGAGLSWYCIATDQVGPALAFWSISGICGAVVAGAYQLRELLHHERQQGALARQLAEGFGTD